MPIDTIPLINTPEDPQRTRGRWWLLEAREEREEVTLQIPRSIVALLRQTQSELEIAASDLVAAWVAKTAQSALETQRRELDVLADPSRITGWLPTGHVETRS